MIKKSDIDVALLVGVIVVVKLVLDAVFALHGNTNNVFDILDFKDAAKQYLYAQGYPEKRHLFLITAGGVRSPWESVLIAIGAALLGVARIDLATYLVALGALAVLIWAALAVKAEVWALFQRPGRADSTALLLALLLFAPLTVGLSRSSLVELPMTACLYAVYALCLTWVRAPKLRWAIWLNLFVCAGMFWSATFPIYVALPLAAAFFFTMRRPGGWKIVLVSIVFQLIAQRAYGYLLVNRAAILQYLLFQANAHSVKYQDGLIYNLVIRGLGLPLVLVLALFVVARVGRAGHHASLDDKLVPLTADDAEMIPSLRWPPERVIFALGVVNLLLILLLQVSAQSQYVRFFYFVLPAILLATTYLYESVVPRRLWWMVVGPAALAGAVITGFYSVSQPARLCERVFYRLLLAQSCNQIEPVDGSAYSPVGGRVAAPLALAALKAHGVASGGLVLLVGSNIYDDSQVFNYYARDTLHNERWSPAFRDIDRGQMDQVAAYPAEAAGAVLVTPTNHIFTRVLSNGYIPPMLDARRLGQMKRDAEARLKALGLVPVAQVPDAAGDMTIYAKPSGG